VAAVAPATRGDPRAGTDLRPGGGGGRSDGRDLRWAVGRIAPVPGRRTVPVAGVLPRLDPAAELGRHQGQHRPPHRAGRQGAASPRPRAAPAAVSREVPR